MFWISVRRCSIVQNLKRCGNCKQYKDYTFFAKHKRNKDGFKYECRDCHINYLSTVNGFMSKLNSHSKTRGRTHNLKTKYLIDLWYSQKGICTVSTIPMVHVPNSNWKCSLERINPLDGYVQGNVKLICQEFNTQRQWTSQMVNDLPLKINERAYGKQHCDMMRFLSNPQYITGSNGKKSCIICNKKTRQSKSPLCSPCGMNNALYRCSLNFIHRLLSRAKWNGKFRGDVCPVRGEFEMDLEWTLDTLHQQDYRCYYSRIPLLFEHKSPWSCSPERLQNKEGYSRKNTRFICQIFNTSDNTNPKYRIVGSPQWSREKMNYFLMHRHGFQLDYTKVFT